MPTFDRAGSGSVEGAEFNAVVVAVEALQAGPRVLGPFHLDHTQFPTTGAQVTLFTPNAGDVLIKAFGDGFTAVPFNDTGSIDFAVGEDPPGPDFDNSVGFWGFLGNGIGPDGGAGVFPDTDDSSANTMHGATATGTFVFTGVPIVINAISVGGDGTTGEMDLYFVIATPITV